MIPWTVVCQAPLSTGFSRQEYWSREPFPSPRDLPNPGIKPGSPSLQVESLPSEPPGQPKNTGMGGLSLLQEIFLTQESNRGLLHCRRILYQLSYQGSPALATGFCISVVSWPEASFPHFSNLSRPPVAFLLTSLASCHSMAASV